MTAEETKAALHARALDVCAYLLPAGRLNGDEFEVGSLAGEVGRSLKVNLNGKVGVWRDFATDDGGDNLLELWRRVHECNIKQAMRESADWLGSRASKPEHNTNAAVTIPRVPADAPKGHPKWHSEPAGVWCYTDTIGAAWLIVYRYNTNKRKVFFQYDYKAKKWIKDGGHQLPKARPLYNRREIGSRSPGRIVLVEGEKCVATLASLGILATTWLGGAGAIEQADLSPLQGWEVLIWPDADPAGGKCAQTATKILLRVGATPFRVPVPHNVAEKWDVADAVRDGWTGEEIRAQLEMAQPIEAAEPIETPAEPHGRFRFLTDEDLERQPDLPDLVKGTFPAASFIVLAAQPAAGKTTLALELAGDVGCDLLFHGRPVTTGLVVFVAAEGASKLGLRVKAWKSWHKVPKASNIYFLAEPVHFGEASEVDALLVDLKKLPSPPVLVVVDTLARCMIGADENSARDVGDFVNGCDRIRQATGAAVLIVHHTTKNGNAERGSGALRGAADTLVMLNREDDLVTVTCEKQKDGAPFEPLHFRLRMIDLGNERAACVLDPAEAPGRATEAPPPGKLPDTRRRVLEALRNAAAGATFGAWQRLAQETAHVSESTFQRAVKDLVTWGRVIKRGTRYFAGEAS